MFKNFKIYSSNEVHNTILDLIDKYDLSRSDINSYEFYNCNSNDGLGSYNKEKYFKLREDYNNNPTWDKFYTLITCSFSNQIRFNSKGYFNMPYGKRDYNLSLQQKLKTFIDKLHNISVDFYNQDFIEVNLATLSNNDFVYCDPPYFNSTATYNENGGWTQENENNLLDLLNNLNSKGIKFALSNNLTVNPALENWANYNEYTIHNLSCDYSNCNYQKKDKKTRDVEVLITNY